MSQERPDAVADELRRARQLRLLVDMVSEVIRQGRLSREEAERLVASTRARALDLFPGKAPTFDLVLAPRFARLRRGVHPAGPGQGDPLPAAAAGALTLGTVLGSFDHLRGVRGQGDPAPEDASVRDVHEPDRTEARGDFSVGAQLWTKRNVFPRPSASGR